MTPETTAILDRLRADRDASTIAGLFDADAARFDGFSARCGEILFDYSKTSISAHARAGLLEALDAAGVPARRAALFGGEHINSTEGRAVQHMALRAPRGTTVMIDGKDVVPDVVAVRDAMGGFAAGIRDGSISGWTDTRGGAKRFTDVVNIGIGGSDLGPAMATLALAPYHDGPRVHFVSNVDGADIVDALAGLDPASTLFIVASKTFTTQETMTNAASARAWLVERLDEEAVPHHFAALSTALDRTAAFGIPEERSFGFWDWVGGRYSLWSAIGLSVMIAVGPDRFAELLAGAHAVDEHFRTAVPEENVPLLMAAVGIWHRNVCDHATHAILPYDQHLARFPAYLQQLDMESNGKGVTVDGKPVGCDTGAVVWGEPGTNGQHAFYQLIHQGTAVVPADFLIAARPHSPIGDHHEKLAANAFAQTEALLRGKTLSEATAELRESGMDAKAAAALAPHKVFPGNRPTCTFLYPELTPFVLGQLIALHEHRVFVEGTVWGINSFDQWGVELGKTLAGELLPRVKGEDGPARNGSTEGLLAAFATMRG